MASNQKRPGNLTDLDPAVVAELARIEREDKLNDPQKQHNNEMMQALKSATDAVSGLMQLKTGIDANHQQAFGAMLDNNEKLSQASEALSKADQSGNFDKVTQGLDKLSREIQLKLVDVEKAAQTKPDIKPNINVDAPKVDVKVEKPDLKPLRDLLQKELPKQVKQLADAIPEVPETDLSTVEKTLKDMMTVMQQVRDRKIPIPQFPTNMKVVNPDGTPISGGGGGSGTQYTDGASAVTHPIGTQQVFTNGSGVVTAVSTANPLPIVGSISVGGTTDEAAFTAGTSTFTSSGGVYNDSVAALSSGQQGAQRLTANRALHTNLRDSSGTELGTSTNPVRIDPTGTTTQPVSATSLPLPTNAAQETGGNLATLAGGVVSSHYVTNATQINGSAIVTAATGVQKVGITGNAGAVLDAVKTAATAPASGLLTLGVYNSTELSPTTGQSVGIQLDSKGRQREVIMDAAGNTRGANVNASNQLSVSVDNTPTVTANAGTNLNTSALALDATLTGGTQESIIRGGTKGTTSPADITSTASGVNHQPVDVAIYDASGNQITSFGGGTQYAEGTTTSPATGTATLGRYTTSAPTLTNNQLNIPQLDINGNLKVNIAAGASSGAVAQSSTTLGQTGGLTQAAVTTGAPTYTTGNTNPLSLNTSGGLRVDGSGVTQPVSLATNTPTLQSGSTTAVTQATASNLNATVVNAGTFAVQAAQNGTWNITNISGTVSLPTGASTEATLAKLPLSQGSTTSGQSGELVQGAVTTGAPTYTTAQTSPLSLDTSGNLRTTTTLGSGSNVIGKVSIDQTTPGTTNLVALAANQSVNNAQVNGVTVLTGAGATGTGAQRVTIATDASTVAGSATLPAGTNSIGSIASISTSVVPGTAATNLGKAEDSASASGDTGIFALGVRNDNAATATTNANGDYSQVSTDIAGSVFVRDAPATSPTTANVAGSITSVTALAANAARRYAIFYNDSTSDCYIKYGATASSSSFTYYLPSLSTLSLEGKEYSGLISVIWVSATGNLRVTETSI